MSVGRIFVMLIVCVFFAGACATQTKKAPAVGADSATTIVTDGMPVIEGSKDAGIGSGSAASREDTSISRSMDRLEKELQRALASAETVSLKRQRDILILTFRSDSMFGFDSAIMKSGVQAAIMRVADVLVSYPQTRIRIEGHTDSIGLAASNQKLSERRAGAVKNELISRNLQPGRIEIVGFGAARPVALNKTPDGRRQNRRVQIFILP